MVGIDLHRRIRRCESAPALAVCVLTLLMAPAIPASADAGTPSAPTVIMISLDGTTYPQIERADLEWIPKLMRRGATAKRLVPVFPSNTFPNHVSLITGVPPEVHGIVNNAFLDPDRGEYDYDADPTWLEVEPLWAIAARHGVVSASYHWVGSEGAWRNGWGPRHWEKFDSGTREAKKVEKILEWLDLEDPAERPRLITAWFHGADGAGHRSGPDSKRVTNDLREQDLAIGELVAGLEARDAFSHTTLLLVSDHGMLEVERSIDLEDLIDDAGIDARVVGGGGFAIVYTDGDAARARRVVEIARANGLEAHRPAEAPSELRLGHVRFGDVVVVPPPGTSMHSSFFRRAVVSGAHGYRPETPGMSAIFIAFGRAAPAGATYGVARTIDVAATVLDWLGIAPPEWMEGRPLAPNVASGEAASR